MLFGFCKQWVGDQTELFLRHEGYSPQPLTNKATVQSTLNHLVKKNGWPADPSRCIPMLYLLGKVKILLRGIVLWRPSSAVVEPQLQRFYLRTAATAFTLFLQLLIEELCTLFLVLKISDL